MGNVSSKYPSVSAEEQRKSLIHMPPAAIYRNREKTLLLNAIDEHGYEHIPAGSSSLISNNIQQTMTYCKETIRNKDNILGFVSVPLLLTDSDNIYGLMFDADMFKAGKDLLLGNGRKVRSF